MNSPVPTAALVVAPTPTGPFITAHGAEVRTGGTTLRVPSGFVTALALSPDARWLAVGDSAGALSLYEAPGWTLRARAARHQHRVSALAFSDEGTLVSASWDHRALRWSLAPLSQPLDVRETEAAWGMTLEDVLAME